jgi:hypothetical protein
VTATRRSAPVTGRLFPISLEEMIAEVERELALRRRHYPNWIMTGRLKQATAERHITTLEAVVVLLRGLADEPDLVERMQRGTDGARGESSAG